jgi:HPt (histidine-containing phosphotransfer) domain-containing protein
MRIALAGADAQLMREKAHGLLGMCRTFGVTALGETAGWIEQTALGGDLAGVEAGLERASRQFEEVRAILFSRLGRVETAPPTYSRDAAEYESDATDSSGPV